MGPGAIGCRAYGSLSHLGAYFRRIFGEVFQQNLFLFQVKLHPVGVHDMFECSTKDRSVKTVENPALRVQSMDSHRVFPIKDKQGVRPPALEAVKNSWPRACEALELEEPWPRFHDLRRTWKTHAGRSGMDPEIRESIMGHWFKEKAVMERYGRINEAELIRAVDSMTFDHGETEIWLRKDSAPTRDQNVIKPPKEKKKAVLQHDLSL